MHARINHENDMSWQTITFVMDHESRVSVNQIAGNDPLQRRYA